MNNAGNAAPARPKITVLATGGTIAGRARVPGSTTDYAAGTLAAQTLLDAVPQLAGIADITCVQIANIPSQHMTCAVWRDLAQAVLRLRAAADGFVILHGTDTLEETALFLDCVLAGVAGLSRVPVVLTGAMRPADAPSPDGPANILGAVRTAASPEAAGRGVLVVFADAVHEAARVYKADSLAVDAFRSAGGGAAGVIVDGAVLFHNAYAGGEWPDCGMDEAMFDRLADLPEVGVLYGHAGMSARAAAAFLDAADWKGLVYAGPGMGNIHAAARPVLLEAVAARGIPVVCASRVDGALAVQTSRDREAGFLCARRLNPQKARVLLQLALFGRVAAERLQALFDLYM